MALTLDNVRTAIKAAAEAYPGRARSIVQSRLGDPLRGLLAGHIKRGQDWDQGWLDALLGGLVNAINAGGGGGGTADALATTGAAVDVAAAAPPSTGKVLTATDATHATWQTPAAGSGDVTGPAGAIDADLVVFDGVSGKAVKDSGKKLADLVLASEKGAASGVATLTAGSLVAQDPANATATPTAGKIPIADGTGKLDGWVSSGAAAATPSLRALGTGATEACPGNSLALTDSRAPSGAASGDLSGTYPGPTVAKITETSGPTSLTVGAVAAGQYLARSGSSIVGVAPPVNGGWVTLLDADLSAEANQTLLVDGNYTIAGLTWTKYLTTIGGVPTERNAMALVNGQGLVLQPAASSFGYFWDYKKIAFLRLPLSQLLADVDPVLQIRVWVYFSSFNGVNRYDMGGFSVSSPEVYNTAPKFLYMFSRGYWNNTATINTTIGLNGSSLISLQRNTAIAASNDTLVGDVMGLNSRSVFMATGQYSAGWPLKQSLVPAIRSLYTTNAQDLITYAPDFSGFGVDLFAQRYDSTTLLSVTIARVRVDVKY